MWWLLEQGSCYCRLLQFTGGGVSLRELHGDEAGGREGEDGEGAEVMLHRRGGPVHDQARGEATLVRGLIGTGRRRL